MALISKIGDWTGAAPVFTPAPLQEKQTPSSTFR
jgi:hypothetical protein